MNERSIQLSDGRRLGYEILGDPDGLPMVYFHGTPGSRLELSQDDMAVQIPGVRWILPDRPGYGISDPAPSRTLLDWPNDVVQLADHLDLDTFMVSGASGGGPHTLACAYSLADRVSKALIFASPSPASFRGVTQGMAFGNRFGLFLGRWTPWLIRWVLKTNAATFKKHPEVFLDSLNRGMGPPDQRLMASPSVREAILRDMREAYRQGGAGHVVDGPLAMSSQDWGFSLREISIPVYMWHGEEDTLVTVHMAKYLAREIPSSTARIVPGAAHLLMDEPAVVEEMRHVLLGGAA